MARGQSSRFRGLAIVALLAVGPVAAQKRCAVADAVCSSSVLVTLDDRAGTCTIVWLDRGFDVQAGARPLLRWTLTDATLKWQQDDVALSASGLDPTKHVRDGAPRAGAESHYEWKSENMEAITISVRLSFRHPRTMTPCSNSSYQVMLKGP